MVGSIVVAGMLTCCALLLFESDLKATQVNMQHSQIWELVLDVGWLGGGILRHINVCGLFDAKSWLISLRSCNSSAFSHKFKNPLEISR